VLASLTRTPWNEGNRNYVHTSTSSPVLVLYHCNKDIPGRTHFQVHGTWWRTGRGSEGETGEWSGYPVLFTLPRNMVYPSLLLLMRTPQLPVVDWTDAPHRFKWTRSFRRKTKYIFCACAITFQVQSTMNACVITGNILIVS